eukprot:203901-Rhodomonas_salina.4
MLRWGTSARTAARVVARGRGNLNTLRAELQLGFCLLRISADPFEWNHAFELMWVVVPGASKRLMSTGARAFTAGAARPSFGMYSSSISPFILGVKFLGNAMMLCWYGCACATPDPEDSTGKILAGGAAATTLAGLSFTVAHCAAVKPDWKKVRNQRS